jgi:hypothetical protein
MARHEDDRQLDAEGLHPRLEIPAAHAWKPDDEDQASADIGIERIQKR